MEIAIRLFEGQGLGNQIFTIVALYKLSVNLKREPIILEFENFKGYDFIKVNFDIFKKRKKFKLSDFQIINDQVEQEIISGLDKTTHKDFIYELFKSNHKSILVTGNLQNEEFIPTKEELLKIFPNLKALYKRDDFHYKNLILHVRGGDYKKTLARPTSSFYLNSIELLENKFNCKYEKLIICDDFEFARDLLPNFKIISSKKDDKFDSKKAKHHLGSCIKNDFEALIKAKISIIPASTFSFWARVFSHAIFDDSITIAPLNWYGYRLGENFCSPNNYIFKDFIYINKNGKEFNTIQIKQRLKYNFNLRNIKVSPKLRTLLNLMLIKVFK